MDARRSHVKKTYKLNVNCHLALLLVQVYQKKNNGIIQNHDQFLHKMKKK